MTDLKIFLLGAFKVTMEGKSVTNFETATARALLIYLVFHPGMPLQREALANLLWPDQPRSQALHALRQTLNRLNRAIGSRELHPSHLEITPQTIQFNSSADYWLDTDEFKDSVDTVRAHNHRRLEACDACIQHLTHAADLYRGDLLAGFHLDSLPFEEWLTIEREHFHLSAMESLYHLAECHNQRGDYRQAQDYAWRQLKLEPWREEAHRQLMVALSLSGQRSAALAQYKNCRQTLAEELGVEPEQETEMLFVHIRDGILPTQKMPLHNLPAQRTRFFGRKTELGQIAKQLNDPDYRLLTLVGSGGVGKTRLALAAARQVAPYFPDGTWFIPLVEVTEEPVEGLHDRLATAITSAMGIIHPSQENPKSELLKTLRHKECLLILDNFDHLTSGVDIVLEILQQAPKIAIMVTSRVRLNARAEKLLHIKGLSMPHHSDAPDVEEYSSVQLFVDRASRPLTLATPDLAQIVEVCELVKGVPLAIELASALVEQLPMDEIIANLRHDLGSLSTTLQDIPHRHRHLSAVFEQSWRLLSESEQRLLAQLAIFRGDFDRTAIMTVTDARQNDLIGLMHKSLLWNGSPDRYSLHPLVRQFAVKKLETFPELASSRDRHSDYYLSFIGERKSILRGDHPIMAIEEIQAEIANIRAAWKWTVGQIEMVREPVCYIESLGQHADGLVEFYTQVGLLLESERTFREAVDPVRVVASDDQALSTQDCITVNLAFARLLSALGASLTCMGDHAAALIVFQEAEAIFAKTANTCPDMELEDQAMLMVNLGTTYNRVGDNAQAMNYLKTGLTLANQANEIRGEITALTTLAQIATEQGDYDTGKLRLNETLELARAYKNQTHIALVLSTLGTLAWRWGDFDQADKCIQESLVTYKALGNRQKIPRLLNSLGILAVLQNEYEQAQNYWVEGLALVKEMGDRLVMADMLNNLGYINHYNLKDLDSAKKYYQESLLISREIGHRQGATSTLSNLGHLHVLLDKHELAWSYLCEALRDSTNIGVIPLALDALVGVARLRVAVGEEELAAELLGLVLNHPSVEVDSAQAAKSILTNLGEVLPADQIEAAMERGRVLALDALVTELLD